jgi:hypothetical protein
MRTLMGFVLMSAIVMVLLACALVALAVQLLPYIIAGMVISVLLRRRRRPYPPAPRPVHRQPLPPPQHQLPPPGRWVYVPVWVGPSPQRPGPVIDAEVIEDPRYG